MMPIARKPNLDEITRLNIPTCVTCGKRVHELTPVCKECREKELLEAEAD